MSWVGWLIVALIVLWFVGKLGSGSSKGGRSNKKPERNVSHEAHEIAEKVTTIQQFRSLERKLETAENRMSEVESERAYENACHKHDVLQAAVDIAQSKIYQWQFIPNVDLNTPKQILDHAYKVYSNEEYQGLKDKLSGDKTDWYGIDGYGEKEDPEPYLKSLIKFRSIVESSEPRDEIIKKINQLVSRNKSLSEEYFDSDSSLKPGDQWFAEELRLAGLPLAYELYSEGYTTPEICLEIDTEVFSSRKGVGPKKLEQLKQFQATVRSKINNA
ncbi:MAG: hypothetical protein JMN24_18865 [gamma proteobacterium endosymbiont of Lamellibrachia anaximandri]|nr:hypothetical protein [gamma proteobacterium endosymbiont of Lamellibrachia anaximandri]MBL3619691.1 hypothetical protein [gamma proteobacterium endosymbiont of Lamellibrachia anaximandri]